MSKNLNITSDLEKYIINNSEELHPVQKEIIEYNKKMGDLNRLQISIHQAQYLNTMVRVSKIKKILEIGTFTGLSTLSMSLALPDDGKIIALDKNEQTNKVAINFFKKAKQDHKITTLIKPALESLVEIKEKFELIFIDADKGNYKEYYERSLSLLETSGLIIIDNVLWYGEVAKKNAHDKITKTIKNFNEFVSNDKRVEKTIIPLGDGMTICRKL